MIARLAIALLLLMPAVPAAEAASSTTCICRSEDGKGFKERILRHHRWVCDYHFKYEKGESRHTRSPRPPGQTCNIEEVVQLKVYLCVSNGCTYPYAAATEQPNKKLEEIKVLQGKRTP